MLRLATYEYIKTISDLHLKRLCEDCLQHLQHALVKNAEHITTGMYVETYGDKKLVYDLVSMFDQLP